MAQFRLLRILERRGPVSMTELGRLTELDRSTIGRNARLLERMGLVRPAPGRISARRWSSSPRTAATRSRPPYQLWAGAQARIEASLGADAEERLRALRAL